MNTESKRKRSSTGSELENSVLETSNTQENQTNKNNKQKKKKAKRANNTSMPSESISEKVSSQLDEINKKLNQVLTKDDRSFIRNIIVETIDEMKDKIISSVVKRLEILESENHERAIETTALNKTIEKQNEENQTLHELNNKIQNEFEKENNKLKEQLNDLEQYGRRNNIRITGIAHDAEKQTSAQTTGYVLDMLNLRMKIQVASEDIDIAHRIGKFEPGKSRPIIVRFVQRELKSVVMRASGDLHKSKCGIYVNEDLTHLNNTILACLRKKDPERVLKCWSYEGKLFARFKSENGTKQNDDTEDQSFVRQVKYSEFSKWLSLPWPKEA